MAEHQAGAEVGMRLEDLQGHWGCNRTPDFILSEMGQHFHTWWWLGSSGDQDPGGGRGEQVVRWPRCPGSLDTMGEVEMTRRIVVPDSTADRVC